MDVGSFLERIKASRDYAGQIVATRVIEARPARCAEPKTAVDPRLRDALAKDGIEQFYTHQAAAIDAVTAQPHDLAATPVASPLVGGEYAGDAPIPTTPGTRPDATSGRDVVVVTGTASGKTLCYNVPVINALIADPDARALYLYPTKALTQDQLGAVERICTADPFLKKNVRASTYDGDTSPYRRRAARHSANIILSNPDMLHSTILPQHPRWAREGFFPNLKYVVIDEVHAYRGTFGSHVANVIRRLRRICNHYGADPTFICCSATIANPGELASRLIGREVTVIDDDGAPRGRKHFVLWNPPFLDDSRLERRSANIEAQRLMQTLITEGAQTITFARARVVAELIYKYVSESLLHRKPALAKRVRPYRGGYLANERREIERQLFSGELLGVCSTNALELGIDVGTLDAAIITGFPGTICSVLQQAGRAGRSKEESLAVFIAYNDPIDQYFMRHPDYFFSQSAEHAAIAPHNDHILESQLKCAARELPIAPQDNELFGCDVTQKCAAFIKRDDDNTTSPPARNVAPPLVGGEHTDHAPSAGPETWQQWPDGRFDFHRTDGRLPHHSVNLRLISSETFDIIDTTPEPRASARADSRKVSRKVSHKNPPKDDNAPRSIGNVDAISAPELVYPNAVYIHEGENFLVRDLDYVAKIARVERTDVDYYTQAVLTDHCRVIETQEVSDAHPGAPGQPVGMDGGHKHFGKLDVTWQTVAFKKIKYYTLEVIGQDALDLPPQTIHTTGVWATFPKRLHRDLTAAGFKPIEAMVGVRNLLLVTLPMLAMCDRRDISGCVESSNLGELAMFVYDRYEGGLGYSKLGFDHFAELLTVCRELLADCPCPEGCPSCVGLANLRPPLHTDPDVGPGYSIPNKSATAMALEQWPPKTGP